MIGDKIECEIVIEAPVERVWVALTEATFLGKWLGTGAPAKVDLWPGGLMLFDHGDYGALPARIEKVERPHYFSYRWSQREPGEEPTRENSTLVEFSLSADGAGTRLRVVESGFAQLVLPQETRRRRHEENSVNWERKLTELRAHVEQPVT